jgi:predicted ATPase
MKRFMLTGAPGAGKTVIIRQLDLEGFSVVEEAATDIIALRQAHGVAEPWTQPSFIDDIVDLQRLRLNRATDEDAQQFHDRSAICTAALATYLEYPVSEVLARELECIQAESIYEKRIFFIRNLGFIKPTEARRISWEDSLRFERVHEDTYRRFGFEILFIEPGTVSERVAFIRGLSGAGS